MHGFHDRFLCVDLSEERCSWHELGESRLQEYLGGIGLGASLLYEFSPRNVDALSAENPLIFTSAPLVGTGLTTTAKYAVVTKSPLTGFIADSLSSSYFALELKRVAIDALVIIGRASAPAYLFITDESAEIRGAEDLWGRSARETEQLIRAQLGDQEARVAAIGVAGENCVRYATISNEGRHAGRGGVGAVMGSKNLKAVVLRGHAAVKVADPRSVGVIAATLRKRSLGTLTSKYREIGTVANLAVFNQLGALPTRNFQQATFDHAEDLSGESLTEHSFSRKNGCACCTIRCERLFKSLRGDEQRLEYETLFALGPLCGIEDPETILRAARLCDHYGMDTISAGGTLAWAMECAEKGLLPDAGTIGLRFGRSDALLTMIPAIAERHGLGALLAEGTRRAAALTSEEAAYWAMHVKGLEIPGYEPRSLKTMALGLAVSPRGACHNRSGAYEADFSGEVDRFQGGADRGAMVKASEDFNAVLDSLIVCKFLRKCFDNFYEESAQLLERVTGWNYSAVDLRRTGERISNIKKLFNQRAGWQPQDDWLPARLLREPLPDGVGRGVVLTAEELRAMILSYYCAREWDENGRPKRQKLKELNLGWE
jgi:aldehyde:ferredoxin oxidoreductase